MTCFLILISLPWQSMNGAERRCLSNADAGEKLLLLGGEVRERGPRAAAMGGSATAVPGGAETALFNPAMLVGSVDGGMLLWTPARFGMTELGAAAAAWSRTFSGLNTAVSLQRFGFELYSEHRLDLSVALPIGSTVAAGARVSALHINIAHYGSTVLPIVDIGVRCSVVEGLEVAAVGFALNMPLIDDDERLPAGLSVGLA
ncbi:MAG: hypothetical protein WC824_11645, partial [Bacteroidota bacterium]